MSNQYQTNMLNSTAISDAIRKLEVDNISWTTALMYTLLYGPPAGVGDMRLRLIRNAKDFGRFFGGFYGQEVGDQVQGIMERYLDAMIALIEAYRDDSLDVIQNRRDVLYDIADELAQLIASLNPYWDQRSAQAVLYKIIYNNEEEDTAHQEPQLCTEHTVSRRAATFAV